MSHALVIETAVMFGAISPSQYISIMYKHANAYMCWCAVCLVSGAGPKANESKKMISSPYYLLNKAKNRVLSSSQPGAKTNLAPLIHPKRENI